MIVNEMKEKLNNSVYISEVKTKKSLEELLKKKEEYFVNNTFRKFSMRQKKDFLSGNSILRTGFLDAEALYMTLFMIIVISGLTTFLFTQSTFSLLAGLAAILLNLTSDWFLNKIINVFDLIKCKIKSKKLSKEMFKNQSVDNEVLKYFAEHYSEQQLVLLFKFQNTIKYKDIHYYMENECLYKHGESLSNYNDNESIMLLKAIKCL